MNLNLHKFSKSYGEHEVIKPLDWEVKEGLTWLKGVNGSGKSTLMKSIAGIIPHEGDLTFDDGLSFSESPNGFRQRVNYTPAEPVFPLFLTGEEILSFYQKTRKGDPQKVRMLSERFGADAYLQNRISSYSSGMLKKVSLITGFIGNPGLLALDEPYTTIDKESQEILTELIKDGLVNGLSVLVASHHEVDALTPHISKTFELVYGELKEI